MRKIPLIILLFLLLLLCSSVVSADVSCSFINITQGPQGLPGVNGTSCTVTIGSVSTGSPASVTNVGTPSDSILDFVLQKGDTGDTGAANMTPGPQGPAGDDATVEINSTITGTPASVTNIGTPSDVLLDFVLPKGDKGDPGEIPDVTQFLFINGTRAMTGNLSMGSYYINNLLTGNQAGDAVNRSFVLGQGFITSTYNATYDGTTTKVNNNLANWNATFNATYDSLIGGSTYNTTYEGTTTKVNNNLANWNATYNSTYDGTTTKVNNNLANWNATYNATYDAKPSSTYNTTYDVTSTTVANNLNNWNATYNATYDAKAPATVYGYVTLMAGSAMVTTTNPTVMNQWETTTNKNNYISLNFTDGGSEVAQWIMDFPADWNSTGNVVFTPVWTAAGGSGTCNFTIKAKLFPDDAALDTALATVGTSIDTLTAVGDVDVGPDTVGAAITSVGTGGNTAIIAVSRDSANDTLSGTGQLIGLRVKYIRSLA